MCIRDRKKTNAAPIEMYPTKKRKNVTNCNPSFTPSFNQVAVAGFVVINSALTVLAMARLSVAIKSRLIVLENLLFSISIEGPSEDLPYKLPFIFSHFCLIPV